MKEEDILLIDPKTLSRYVGKIREKNGEFYLKIYNKNEVIRTLKYIGIGDGKNKPSYCQIN